MQSRFGSGFLDGELYPDWMGDFWPLFSRHSLGCGNRFFWCAPCCASGCCPSFPEPIPRYSKKLLSSTGIGPLARRRFSRSNCSRRSINLVRSLRLLAGVPFTFSLCSFPRFPCFFFQSGWVSVCEGVFLQVSPLLLEPEKRRNCGKVAVCTGTSGEHSFRYSSLCHFSI